MPRDQVKVLYVALDMDLGGLQRIVHLLIEGLDRERFRPYLCCLDRGGMFFETLTAKGVEGCILNRRPGKFDARLLINLYQFVRKNQIDVIHSHNACCLYSGLAGFLARVPVIHTDHGRLVPDRPSAMWEDWLASKFLKAFIGVSQELTEYLSRHVRISNSRLLTIVNGVDTAKFYPQSRDQKYALRSQWGLSQDDVIIGTVCRFDPIKNLQFLIDCMPEIVDQVPRVQLIMVGEGPSRADLEQRIFDLGLTDRIQLWSRRQDIEHVMPMFDLYACSSLSEGTSMTILEAMACGLPIIASAVGGNCSLIDKSNGILFSLNDKTMFIASVTSLLTNPYRLATMGGLSRERAEQKFRLRHTIDCYSSLYLKHARL